LTCQFHRHCSRTSTQSRHHHRAVPAASLRRCHSTATAPGGPTQSPPSPNNQAPADVISRRICQMPLTPHVSVLQLMASTLVSTGMLPCQTPDRPSLQWPVSTVRQGPRTRSRCSANEVADAPCAGTPIRMAFAATEGVCRRLARPPSIAPNPCGYRATAAGRGSLDDANLAADGSMHRDG
jgi:hypothetical protein